MRVMVQSCEGENKQINKCMSIDDKEERERSYFIECVQRNPI